MLLFSPLGKHPGLAQGGSGASTRAGNERWPSAPGAGLGTSPPQAGDPRGAAPAAPQPPSRGISRVGQPGDRRGDRGAPSGTAARTLSRPSGCRWVNPAAAGPGAPRRRPALAAPRVLGQVRSRTRVGASRSSPNAPCTPKPHTPRMDPTYPLHYRYPLNPRHPGHPSAPQNRMHPTHSKHSVYPGHSMRPTCPGGPCSPWSPRTPCTPAHLSDPSTSCTPRSPPTPSRAILGGFWQ